MVYAPVKCDMPYQYKRKDSPLHDGFLVPLYFSNCVGDDDDDDAP
jgi:hypothetical protein